MASEKKIIDLCSSDEEDDDVDYDDESEEEEEENGLEESEYEDKSLSGEDSEWSEDLTESDMDNDDDDDDDDEDDVDNGDGGDDEDSLVNKVIQLLKDGRDLKVLKVEECKTYLRKHGLRLTGTKAVYIARIVEHWRLKDGDGEVVYPQSSFVINCRGDVCKGDTVMFTQKVYQKFEKMKRSGKRMGTRTVTGKVVKESYGRAKQQHTFTIEVLWSKGAPKLPPLHPLLVKGRNLYRLRTFRQPWANEDDRIKVLSEKHNRGAAARKIRNMRKEKKMNTERGKCHEKKSYRGKTGKVKKMNHSKGHNDPKPDPNPSIGHKKPTEWRNASNHSRSYRPHSYIPGPYMPNASYVPRSNGPHSYNTFNVPRSHVPYSNLSNSYSYGYQTQNPYKTQNQIYQRPPPLYHGSSTSNSIRLPYFDPQASRSSILGPYRSHSNHYTHHANLNSSHNQGMMNLDRFSEMTINHRSEGETYRQNKDRSRS